MIGSYWEQITTIVPFIIVDGSTRSGEVRKRACEDMDELIVSGCSEKHMINKEERYSRVPRLSDTRYSAKGTKGKRRYASSKARLKCASYRR